MRFNKIAAWLLLVSAAFFVSCKSEEDGKIEGNVSDTVKNENVKFKVKDRVVILTGEVDDPAEKARIEAEVRGVKGVEKVENEITIVLPPGAPTPSEVADATAEAADIKLNREVQAVIVPFPDVKASVNNGVVTLSGDISKAGHPLLLVKIKGLFPKEINDNLTIK